MRNRFVPASILAVLVCICGCQDGPPISSTNLLRHRAIADKDGLATTQRVDGVKISCAVPDGWEEFGLQEGLIYSHQQWRSPTHRTAVGSVYIRLPLPLSATAVKWLIERKYQDHGGEGKVESAWRDAFGREWFEASDDEYHVRGYVMVRGFDAWVNYTGIRLHEPQIAGEEKMADRSLETFLPASVGGI